MSADKRWLTIRALRVIRDATGVGRLVWIGVLMIVSSLTEGIGLLMLVPITALIAGNASLGTAAAWLEPIAAWPVGLLLGVVVALVLFRAVLVFMVLDARYRLGLTLTKVMRINTPNAILAAEWRWLSRQSSSDHVGHLMGEADRVGQLGEEALSIATGIITATILLFTAVMVSWKLTLVALATAGIVASCMIALRLRRDIVVVRFSDAYQALNAQVTNGLFHLRAARIGGAEASLAEQFSHAARVMEQAELQYNRTHALVHVLLQAVAAVSLGVLVYVATIHLHAPLTVLVPVLAIMARLVPVATNLQQNLSRWGHDRSALDGLQDLIAEATVHVEARCADSNAPALRDALVMRGITLRYEGREAPVFDGFDLTIAAGSVVCISGPSGSGKSSLADMLSGLISPDAGAVLVDGQPLEGASRVAWRNRVAYVEQIPYLFDGTIAENLGWGLPRADDEALWRALKLASASFVAALPDGLATRVGEQGRQFSGGERQRLALARALLRQPDLLILDEITSALDSGNEAAVIESIAALKGSCTVLILGHRSTLQRLADHVVELHPGG